MTYITRACPYCGETIVVESDNIPGDIVMTQRSGKLTTLAHIKCMPTRDAIKAAYHKGQSNADFGKSIMDGFKYADTDSVHFESKGDNE